LYVGAAIAIELVTLLPPLLSVAAAVDVDPEVPPQADRANRHTTEAAILSACDDALIVQLIIDPARKIAASRG
jgi:hypothetical protein